jgi:hypothetical protein
MILACSFIQSKLASAGIHIALITLKITVFTYYGSNKVALYKYQVILYGNRPQCFNNASLYDLSRLDFLIRKARRQLPISMKGGYLPVIVERTKAGKCMRIRHC